jgi:hypothetical protein
MKRSLRSWLWRVPPDQEVDEEIVFHIEMRTRELIDRGMDPNTVARRPSGGSATFGASGARVSILMEGETVKCVSHNGSRNSAMT